MNAVMRKKLQTMTDDDLIAIEFDRSKPADVREEAETILQDREEKADRERLADLMDRLAEFVGDHGGALEYGEGKSWTLVTDEDLLRIAELLSPEK